MERMGEDSGLRRGGGIRWGTEPGWCNCAGSTWTQPVAFAEQSPHPTHSRNSSQEPTGREKSAASRWGIHRFFSSKGQIAWLSSQKEASSKDDVCLLRTKDMDYWNHVLWSDETKIFWFRWCQACVATTRWGVKRQVRLNDTKQGQEQ